MKQFILLLLLLAAGFNVNAQQQVLLKSSSTGTAVAPQQATNYNVPMTNYAEQNNTSGGNTYQKYQASVIPSSDGSKYVILASSPKSSNPLYPKTYSKAGDNAIIYYNSNGTTTRTANKAPQNRRIKYYVDGVPQYE